MKQLKWVLVFVLLMLPLLACGINLPIGGASKSQDSVQSESGEKGESQAGEAAESGEKGESQAGDQVVAAPGNMPLYPGAKNFDAGSNPMMKAILEPMIKQLESQYNSGAQVKFYSVPQGTKAADVEQFYKDQMAGLGWKEQKVENQAQSGATTMAWLNGDNEVFVVSFMEMPQMESMLFTVLAKQK